MGDLHARGLALLQLLPGFNASWDDGPSNETSSPFGPDHLTWCDTWRTPQHTMFQLANTCFFISYLLPSTKRGMIFMHAVLVIGFFIFSAWAWIIVCAPDIFIWGLAYTLINIIQLVFLLYRMRPVKFDPELEEAYHTLFVPFKVSRLQFKKLISNDMAQIMSLHAGEAYALQNLTRTDRLGLLLSGKLNVLCDSNFLHPILACEFLDSPEFESRANMDDKFKVSIVAATSCRYLYWQRTSLEYLFAKETYLATVMSTLIARDITTKLYAMNNKIVTEKGYHLDIRLPSITSSLTSTDHKSPTVKALKKHTSMLFGGSLPNSPESVYSSRERLFKDKQTVPIVPNGRVVELVPLKEIPSTEELGSSVEVESWLETSSKYHSCEIVDT